MPSSFRDCWTDNKQVVNCATVGMTTDHFTVERANRAAEEFGNSLLDCLLIMMNIICLLINLVMIIYKRTERTDNTNLRREQTQL